MVKAPKERGIFITFEGGEGAGKTSQITMLENRLRDLNFDVIKTREPGGTPGAEVIRHVLLSGSAEPFGPHMEALLFAAARSDHVESVISPALEAGKIVLCDRFIDSTRVYQGASGVVEMTFLKDLEEITCENAYPDLTIIIDIDPAEGMRRAGQRRENGQAPDRFEKDNLKEQQKRRTAFLKMAKDEPERIRIVGGADSEEEVSEKIWEIVEPMLIKPEVKAK